MIAVVVIIIIKMYVNVIIEFQIMKLNWERFIIVIMMRNNHKNQCLITE